MPPIHYLYTHTHADHCHGFDDLRSVYFSAGQPLKCYARAEFIAELKQRFRYIFEDTGYQGGKPLIDFVEIPETGRFFVDKLPVETISCVHGNVKTSIFKFGRFVYATDFKFFTPENIESWRGSIDTMIASGIRYGKHHTHSTIEETLILFTQLAVKRGIITHLSHDVDYETVSQKLPAHAELAYDGMTFKI